MDFQVGGDKQRLRLGAADSQPNQFESHHLQSAKKQFPNSLHSTVPRYPFHENAEDTTKRVLDDLFRDSLIHWGGKAEK